MVSVLLAVLAVCSGLQLQQAMGLTLSSSATSRSFAQEMGLQAGGNVFKRPTVGVLVVVDGEGPISSEEWTPFLKTLQVMDSPDTNEQKVFEEQMRDKAQSFPGFAFASSAIPYNPDSIESFWKVTSQRSNKLTVEPFLTVSSAKTKHNVIVMEDDEDRLAAELALIESLAEKIAADKETRPGFVYAEIFGLANRNSNDRSKSFHALSTGLEALQGKLRSMTSRPLLQVIFTGKKQGAVPAPQNEAQAEMIRRRLQSSTSKAFRGSDYVIMFWTIVGFIFLIFFVLLCIPWAPTLDPLLRTTLKPESKRD